MAQYRKRPVVVEATQWFEHGDYDRRVVVRDNALIHRCSQCDRSTVDHGWIDTLEGGHRVCPGDWIITGVKGEHYPCKPDIFDATYEPCPVSVVMGGPIQSLEPAD